MADLSPGSSTPAPESRKKDDLARLVVIVGMFTVGTLGLGTIVISAFDPGGKVKDTAQTVLTAILTLFSSWVGTIIAFYFSKDNFEAATRSVTELTKHVTGHQKLQSLPVTEKMIRVDDIEKEIRPPDQVKLVELLNNGFKKGYRLPLMDGGKVQLIIHKSRIDEYVRNVALTDTPEKAKAATIKILLEDTSDIAKEIRKVIGTFGFVPETATLAEAKAAMEALDKCQDVFVTKTGKKDEPILGWITNIILQENSRA